MTYAQLKEAIDKLTPEQLTEQVKWIGEERGGKVSRLWIVEEDWIGDRGDWETAMPRSAWERDAGDEAKHMDVMIKSGTPFIEVEPQ